jgi:hypothetical protein
MGRDDEPYDRAVLVKSRRVVTALTGALFAAATAGWLYMFWLTFIGSTNLGWVFVIGGVVLLAVSAIRRFARVARLSSEIAQLRR